MNVFSVNNYTSIPRFSNYEIEEIKSPNPEFQGLSPQSILINEEYIEEESFKADCLQVPIGYLSLEALNEAKEFDKTGFYALAQSIFQFAVLDREKIYNILQLTEKQKDDLEGFNNSDPTRYQNKLKDFIESFVEKLSLNLSENVLTQVANHLEINLVIFKQQEDRIEIIGGAFSTAKCFESDHSCFRSQLCVAVAEQKKLFKKNEDRTILIDCNVQTASIIEDVYAELARIRRTILAIHNRQKTLEDLEGDLYRLWYEKHTSHGVLNFETALRDLSGSEIDIEDFSEKVLKQELRKYPLAIIRANFHLTKKNFEFKGEKYEINETTADGACALHALLGEEIDGKYNAGSDVKMKFANKLKDDLNARDATIIAEFIGVINPMIRAPLDNCFNKMLFVDSPKGSPLKESWDALEKRYDRDLKKLSKHEAAVWVFFAAVSQSAVLVRIMKQIENKPKNCFYGKNSEEVLRLLVREPAKILEFINEDTDVFINLLTGDHRQQIANIRAKRGKTLAELKEEEQKFILEQNFIDHYTEILNDPNYYLNTQEISLAAHMFNKKVQILLLRSGGVELIENLMNESGSGELIVIRHEGNHFERCVPVQRSSIENERRADNYKNLRNYGSIDLKKLQNYSTATYGVISCVYDLENILEFQAHKNLDDQLFAILYGDESRERITKEYDRLFSEFFEHNVSKEDFLSEPTHLEGSEDSSILIDIKKGLACLVQKMIGQKNYAIQKILRESGIFQHIEEAKEIAKKIIPLIDENKIEETQELLFKELYEKRSCETGLKNEKRFKINDNVSTSQETINQENMLSVVDPHRGHQKSLEELCIEYVQLNPPHSSSIESTKRDILQIRKFIAYFKSGQLLPIDTNPKYPLALIADICVKIENQFGDMLRDSQLLAILALLSTGNPKGILSQIETGEGKTYVIVALAIIKNREGYEVDVITSSSTLAKRDVEKFKQFYREQFGVFCEHNCDSDVGMMANPCYQPNSIIYGTTASFEGDSLRAEFYRASTFNGRGRGIVIVDEADSALLDKAGWLCQMSDSVAGMSTVRPLLYYIWALVLKKVDEVKERKFESKEVYDSFLDEIKKQITGDLEAFFSGGDQSFLIPGHLKKFIEYRISYWVNSALRAIFYTQDREYNACQKLKKITPIDYANTGEWEKDVQWEDGLHQFLQMKNGMGVETETLTKAFMPNYTLINKYSFIYGVSGTLGEADESETYDELFGVAICKIPKFKACCYEEKVPWMSFGKEEWLDSLYTDVVKDGELEEPVPKDCLPSGQEERRRASLIICKTIADVKEIEQHFKNKKIHASDIITYTNGDEDKTKIQEATKGKIIIATNLSGRGTDIDASSIEGAGGLHVIFSFLPANRRIQDQGFGRTARKGLSGSARLIIKAEDIKEHHLKKTEIPLLDICNDLTKGELNGFKLIFENNLWEVESDSFNGSIRELRIKKGGDSVEKKTVQLSYSESLEESVVKGKKQETYNAIKIDEDWLEHPKNLQTYSFELTYDSIIHGRNQREKSRLRSLRTTEKESLIKKQHLFENFQNRLYKISNNFRVDPRLTAIHLNLLELYKSYILDEWAIFIDRVSKDLQLPNLESFDYALDLDAMLQKNDLYKMQYINASIDVDNEEIRREADAFYEERGKKVDITGAFACYNRVFVTLKNNKGDIAKARSDLNKANEIFEKGEAYEKGILKVQYEVFDREGSKISEEEIEGTPMLRLILTMKVLVKRNLEELDELAKDYSKLKVSFTNPYELKENLVSPAEKKEGDEKGYTIPDDLIDEAIKLGLKGPLKLEGEGSFWQALLCAIICVVVAIAALAAIALSGGAAAPLVSLLGGEIVFGVIAGAVAGAAISGAINAIKGAINGDFSFSRFGKDVLIGLIAGAIGGGVAAGLARFAGAAIQAASNLGRVAINIGVGAAAGVGAGAAGYLVGAGLHGRKVTWEEFAKALVNGVVGGALGGGFAGLSPYGAHNIGRLMLAGALGDMAGNAAIQGVRIAMGDATKFDVFELLENVLYAGVEGGIMARAQRRAAKQLVKQNPRKISYMKKVDKKREWPEFNNMHLEFQEGAAKKEKRFREVNIDPNAQNRMKLAEASKAHRVIMKGEELNRMEHFKQKRRGSFDIFERAKNKSSPSHLDYLNLEDIKKRKFQDKLRAFDRMEAPLVYRDKLANGFSSIDGISSRPRSRSDSFINVSRRPILFEKGKAWTNVPPKQKQKKVMAAGPVVKNKPKGEYFLSIDEAKNKLLKDIKTKQPVEGPYEIKDDKGHKTNSVGLNGEIKYEGYSLPDDNNYVNTTKIYETEFTYEYIDKSREGHPLVRTNYVALQHHPQGHLPEIPQPHLHVRPAYPSSVNPRVFHIDGNKQLPANGYDNQGYSCQINIPEHYFIGHN